MKVAVGLVSLALLLTPRTVQSSREWCHLIDDGPRGARRRRLRMVGGSGLRQPFTMAAGDAMFVGWVTNPPSPLGRRVLMASLAQAMSPPTPTADLCRGGVIFGCCLQI
jgi:hypothetical protein